MLRIYTTLIFLCFIFVVSNAQTNRLSSLEVRIIDQLIEEEMLFQEIYGISIGIVKDGKIVYTKGYGHTDLDRKKPVATSTVYNWASISKTLTAVAAFQLIEDGLLSKSSKPKTVLEGIWTNPEDIDAITLSRLLSHRSGIRHYDNDLGDDTKANRKAYTDTDLRVDWNARQSVAIFNGIELKTDPGEAYRYSTYGYNLAGAMIDKVSPNGYVGHITQRILGPLDTKSIDISRKSYTAFSKNCHGAVKVWKEKEKRSVLPGGGWHSNIQDLTIFMNALINKTLLKNTSALWADVMIGEKALKNGGYRFGLRVESDTLNNELIVRHGGKHENVRTLMVFFPKSNLGFTIMINGGYADVDRVFRKLATAFGKPQKRYAGPLMRREFIRGCDNDIAGFWSKGEETSLVRFGYDQKRFNDEYKHLESKGYKLKDCEYFIRDEKLLMSGIFSKEGNPTKYIPPSNYTSFAKVVQRLEGNRYKLTDIEVFQKDNKTFWSGIASKQLNNPFIIKDLDLEAFKIEIERQKGNEQMLIDIESYPTNSGIKWAGLFRSGSNFKTKFMMTKANFADSRSELRRAGYALVDLEITEILGVLVYTGIFHSSDNSMEYRSERTHTQISDLNNNYVADSLRLVDIEKPFSKN